MSDLLQRIQSDTQAAMRAHERQRVNTLRFISATLRQAEIDQREALDDTEALRILDRLAKQYQESIETYRRAGSLRPGAQGKRGTGAAALLPA